MSYQIPFTKSGQMVRYPDNSCEMKDNYEFSDYLQYCGYGRGRSAAYLKFKGFFDGFYYYMFMSDFDDVVCSLNSGVIWGTFTFVKKGQNFGIKRIFKDK